MWNKIKEEIIPEIFKNIKGYFVLLLMNIGPFIYAFILGIYYEIHYSYFLNSFKEFIILNSILIGIILIPIIITILLMKKNSEFSIQEKDIFSNISKIINVISVVYFGIVLFVFILSNSSQLLNKYLGNSVYLLCIILFVFIISLFLLSCIIIIKRNYKGIKVIFFVMFILAALLSIQKFKKGYEVIWIDNKSKVILSKYSETYLISDCDVYGDDEQGFDLIIKTKKLKEISSQNNYNKSYIYFKRIDIDKRTGYKNYRINSSL